MAPEYLQEYLYAGTIKPNNSKVDVWSIGVIAYQLCTNQLPFYNKEVGTCIPEILNNPHDPIPDKLYSDQLKDIINRMLTKDPTERPSIRELKEVPIIRHALDAFIEEFEGESKDQLQTASLIKKFEMNERSKRS